MTVHLDVRLGLDLAFVAGALSFDLATPAAADIDSAILGNAIRAEEALVQALLPSVVALLLPSLTGSLDTFPLPEFLGLSLQPVEISRQGEFMSLFVDLAP